MNEPQMCTVDDLIGGEPCLRVAQHVWHPEADDHPVYLCNFHAEPFAPFPASGKEAGDGAT
jgi:hypothetical protein